jgi:LacI family transcriptional regulator
MTLKEIARKARCSTATVSRVLSGDSRISVKTRERVAVAVMKTGFRPNNAARSLKTRRSRLVGFVAPEMVNDFFMTVADAAERKLEELGFRLILCNSSGSRTIETRRLALLQDLPVDGVILVPAAGSVDLPPGFDRPLVLVDRLARGLSADAFLTDNKGAVFDAIGEIARSGGRDIGFLGSAEAVTSAAERHRHFRAALTRAGLEAKERWIKLGDFGRETGYRLMAELYGLRGKPEWVLIANHYLHIGAAQFLAAEAPDWRVKLASFDDMSRSAFLPASDLLIAQDMGAMGTGAAEAIARRIDGDEAPVRVVRLAAAIRRADHGFTMDRDPGYTAPQGR